MKGSEGLMYYLYGMEVNRNLLKISILLGKSARICFYRKWDCANMAKKCQNYQSFMKNCLKNTDKKCWDFTNVACNYQLDVKN